MTGSAISAELGISRITMSRYLDAFTSDGIIVPHTVGNSIVWNISKNVLRFELPDEYTRASEMYSDAVSLLSEERATSVIRSCTSCGAEAVSVLTEILGPAIDRVRKSYDDGKIGSAERALMHSIISRSMAHLASGQADTNRTRNAITLATDAQSALYAEAAAAILCHDGWRVMRLGDMSHAVGVLLDTELEKLLMRTRVPRDGIVAMIIFSDSADALRTFGAAADSARRVARGTLLVLCGPQNHGVDADASVASAKDVVHWARSLSRL